MKLDFTNAVKAKETGKFLSPGIKEATFEGIEFANVKGKDGQDYQTMVLKLTIDGYGAYTQNFFEPKSEERKDNAWGGKNASPADDFLILIREILQALNPDVLEQISDGTLQLRGKGKFNGTFRELVLAMIEITASCVGEKVEIKLLPQNNGFASIPTFVAKITRNNELAINTWVIGHDLTLSESEKRRIDTAAQARPTNMATTNVVNDMKDDLDSDSDLPF